MVEEEEDGDDEEEGEEEVPARAWLRRLMNALASCWVSGVRSNRLRAELAPEEDEEEEEEEGAEGDLRGRNSSDCLAESESANRTERGMGCLRRSSAF